MKSPLTRPSALAALALLRLSAAIALIVGACAIGSCTVESTLGPTAVLDGPTLVTVDGENLFDGAQSTDPDSRIVDYTFDFGDGSAAVTGPAAATSHAFDTAGTFTVTLTVADRAKNQGSASLIVTVEAVAAAGVGPTALLTTSAQAVVGDGVFFDGSGSSGGDGTITMYEFDYDGDLTFDDTGSQATRVHTYTTDGVMDVTLRVTTTFADGSTATDSQSRQIEILDSFVEITSLSPDAGDAQGDNDIQIFGESFTSPADTVVLFGDTAAPTILVFSQSEMLVTTPAGDPGVVDVTVINSNGAFTLPDSYTYEGASNLGDTAFCWQLEADAADVTTMGFAAAADDQVLAATLPFTFQHFGIDFTSLLISSNGFISFSEAVGDFGHANDVPHASLPKDLVAPFFFDLNVGTGAIKTLTFGSSPDRRFVVRWEGVTDNASESDVYTFEAALYESSNDVVFQYLNTPSFDGDLADDAEDSDAGIEALIGLQNHDASAGSPFSRNALVTGLAPGGRTIVFGTREGVLTQDTATTPSVAESDLGTRLLDGGNTIDVAFSRVMNPSSASPTTLAAPPADGNVTIEDLDVTDTLIPIDEISFDATKTIMTITLGGDPIGGHNYRLTIGSTFTDPNGVALSQDPMGLSCGGSAPTDFTATFVGLAEILEQEDQEDVVRGILFDNSHSDTVYVAGFGADTIRALSAADPSTAEVIATAGTEPQSLAIDTTNDLLLATNLSSDALTVLDLSTTPPTDAGEIAIDGTDPDGVAVIAAGATVTFARAVIANDGTNTVSAANLIARAACDNSGATVGESIAMSTGANTQVIAVDPDADAGGTAQGRYFVGNDTAFFIMDAGPCDGVTEDIEAAAANIAGGVADIVLNGTATVAMVANATTDSIHFVDIDAGSDDFGTVLTALEIDLAGDTAVALAMAPDGQTLVAALVTGRALGLFNVADLTAIARVDADGDPTNGTDTNIPLGACVPEDLAVFVNGGFTQYWLTCQNDDVVVIQ